ncbi:hypothetical protein PIB30_039481 [Stylosanthes scabra]|uniref:Uncharacterized protein n=1 Tax=Stylosanthes scabra TaxID=79078 RepID=A0ABU6XG41_9FABA|nr:hypothetical protein [Stylosanthes scabra]
MGAREIEVGEFERGVDEDIGFPKPICVGKIDGIHIHRELEDWAEKRNDAHHELPKEPTSRSSGVLNSQRNSVPYHQNISKTKDDIEVFENEDEADVVKTRELCEWWMNATSIWF